MALVIMDLRWDTSVEAVEFPIRNSLASIKARLKPPIFIQFIPVQQHNLLDHTGYTEILGLVTAQNSMRLCCRLFKLTRNTSFFVL